MCRAALLILLAVVLTGTSTAHAESRVETYWHKTLIPDAIGTSVVVLGLSMAPGEVIVPGSLLVGMAGAAVYLIGAPLTHIMRNNEGPAFASFGLRVALPVAGAYLVPEDHAPVGLVAGMLTAVAIDAIFFARQTVEVEPRTWAPTAIPTQGGLSLGVSGAF